MIKNNRIASILVYLLIVCLITGCSSKSTVTDDILSMKKPDDQRTQITVLVKHAFSIHNFEKIVEDKFPDIDIVQVGNYTANTVLAKEYEARLEHGDLTDMVMTWPLEVGNEYFEDQLIDLAGMGFTSKYKTSMLDFIARGDGSLYYLPGPADIRGIIYNKTLFEENGWSIPTSYEEFLSLCKTIDATGIRGFQLPLGNEEVLDTAFTCFNYGGFYSKPSDAKWLESYNKGQGAFLEHFQGALETYQELANVGIFRSEDLNMHYEDTQRGLFQRAIAMSEDSVLLTHKGKEYGNMTDEFAIMPFFDKKTNSDWARIYMTCYIGLNKKLLDDENKEKYEKTLQIMEFISSQVGQDALSSDSGAMYSSLKKATLPETKEIETLAPTLREARYGSYIPFKRCNTAFRRGLTNILTQETNIKEVASALDEENQKEKQDITSKVYGEATEDFTLIETGNLFTDVMRKKGNSDFALFLDNGKDGLYNGKGIGARIYQGDFNEDDLSRVFPDLMHGEQGYLWTVTMTGENLIKTLEDTMEINGSVGWFYYFSGLKIKFNPYAKMGQRILHIETENGQEIEKDRVYSIAVMEDSVPEQYIIEKKELGVLIQYLIIEEFKQNKKVSPSKDQRFIIQY